MKQIYKAINVLVTAWKAEGDTTTTRELWHDAIVHIRWRMEKGLSATQAAAKILELGTCTDN